MKKAATVIIAFILFHYPAAALGAAHASGETAGMASNAQAPPDVNCPYCDAKNEAGAVYCANCGKKLPELRTEYNYCPKCGEKIGPGDAYCAYCGFSLAEIAQPRTAESRWERRLLTLSGGIGAWFGNRTCVAPTVDLLFNVSDYFALGPDFAYFFHRDGSGYLVGGEFRPYIIPYSRSYFLKPHVTVGVGYGREKIDVSWRYYMVNRWYVRPGGGLDVRIASSRFVTYLNWAVLIIIRGNFEDPWRLNEDQITGTGFVFEGGLRVTL